jgi:hypothetical protein
MNVKIGLSCIKVLLQCCLLLLFIFSAGLLKAQEGTPEVEPPAPQAAQPSGPLATTESEQNPDVSLEVRELKRTSGGMLTLKFGIMNNSK